MRLFDLQLPNGRRIIAAGIAAAGPYRFLVVWLGTREISLNLNRAPVFRPGAMARW